MKTRCPWLPDDWCQWWKSLTARQKAYVWYFYLSFILVACMADCNPLWVVIAAVLNFGNSVRLIKKVPIDKLED